jgi:hypothetical protein
MEWLKSIYDNAMSNAERMTGGYAASEESRFGLLIAILGQRRDDDERR